MRVCRSVLFALLLTKVYDLRGTDIAVFTKVTQDGKLVLAPPRARVFFFAPLFDLIFPPWWGFSLNWF